MNFLVRSVLCGVMAIGLMACGPSEKSIRDKVVKLSGEHGMCSGEQVKAPSGDMYILTAGHCRTLEKDGSILVTKEDGTQLRRNVIAEDPNADLLLLEGLPNVEGLSIADNSYRRQDVRTFTHGRNFDTYKTSGVLIQQQKIQILNSIILDEKDEAACKDPKYKIMEVPIFFGFTIKACLLDVEEMATTAMIVPGSSGGAVVSNAGELVGVVSAGGDTFGWLVPLSAIHVFLAGY